MSGIMFNPSNPNLKTFSLANIIEEQLSSISLGGSLHNLEGDPNIVGVLEDRQTSDSESSISLAEARRNSSGKDDVSAPSHNVNKIVEALSCAEVRWFYKEPGNTKWTPFGGYDTLTIEGAYSKLPVELRNPIKLSPKSETASPLKEEEPPEEEAEFKVSAPKVLVLGGLYELDFISRTCSSIYWPDRTKRRAKLKSVSSSKSIKRTSGVHSGESGFIQLPYGEMFRCTRGTWFYESWQPLDEEAADIIEQDHLKVFLGKKASDFAVDTKPLHYQSVTDFNVDWYSPNEVYIYSRGTPSKLVRSFTKKLGYFQKSAGTRVLRSYKSLATDADKHKDISHLVFVVHGIGQKMNIGAQIFRNTCVIRERVATLKEKYFPESNQRAEFFPVEWRSNLVLDGGTVDAITPPHIKYLRQVLNTSAMDIMYYTSPIYCGEIQEGVAAEMNRLYNMFCERNPHIKPKISVIAHSLGAVIVYDIVTGYIPQGFNTDGSFIPGKSRLNFELDKFFCLGSPLSVFLALRSKKGEHGYHLFPPSLCSRLYNVYHLTDPVAYRLEPLVLKDYCKIAPLPIHPCNAVKPLPYSEMPLEIEETEGFLSTTPGSASGTVSAAVAGACAAAVPSAGLGESSSTTSPADTPCKDKGWSIWNTIWKNQKNQESGGGSPHHMDSPSQGLEHRLDYVLTSGAAMPFVVRSVLVSHTAYWSNNDVAFFVLTRIFPELEDELCSEERYAKPNGRRKHKRRRGSSKGSWTRKRKFDATYRSFSKCVSQTKRRITRIWST